MIVKNRTKNLVEKLDFFYEINKKWVTINDIQKICGCSKSEAKHILKQLKSQMNKKNVFIDFVHQINNVPMSLFLEYIGYAKVERIQRYHDCLLNFYSYKFLIERKW